MSGWIPRAEMPLKRWKTALPRKRALPRGSLGVRLYSWEQHEQARNPQKTKRRQRIGYTLLVSRCEKNFDDKIKEKL